MKYKPEYAKGQILVSFKGNFSDDFVTEFGKGLGYNLSRNSETSDNYIFFTPIGMEGIAIQKFMEHPEFVDWASLRDIKLEVRWKGLEKAVAEIQNLIEDAEMPDKDYRRKLNEIISCLRKSACKYSK